MSRLTCVRYTDAMSIGRSSFNDLELGKEHNIVGANGKAFGASKPGDRVIIVANRGAKKYFQVVVIQERLLDCTLWATNGGHVWSHNFLFRPVTGICELDGTVITVRNTVAKELLLNSNNLFHSRFCSAKLNRLLDGMLVTLPKHA